MIDGSSEMEETAKAEGTRAAADEKTHLWELSEIVLSYFHLETSGANLLCILLIGKRKLIHKTAIGQPFINWMQKQTLCK